MDGWFFFQPLSAPWPPCPRLPLFLRWPLKTSPQSSTASSLRGRSGRPAQPPAATGGGRGAAWSSWIRKMEANPVLPNWCRGGSVKTIPLAVSFIYFFCSISRIVLFISKEVVKAVVKWPLTKAKFSDALLKHIFLRKCMKFGCMVIEMKTRLMIFFIFLSVL